MPRTPAELFAHLDRLGLDYRTYDHPPAFTVAEGREVWGGIPGVHCKNLFLKDAKGALWLVTCAAERRVDLKALPQAIGAARISFGQPPLLMEVLGIEPGSVTPFAVINDEACRVTVILDAWMMAQPLVAYHPLRNDATTVLAPDALRAFLRSTGHVVREVWLGEDPHPHSSAAIAGTAAVPPGEAP